MPHDGPSTKQIAGRGSDIDRAQQLLAASERRGAAVLGTIVRTATTRLLAAPRPAARRALFSTQEKTALANVLAATNATAQLLGRARIREHQRAAYRKYAPAKHAELPPAVHFFDGAAPAANLKPLEPEKALRHFRGLVPTLGIPDPRTWATGLRESAFGLAVATDQELLQRVQDAIAERLEQGNAATGPAAIQDILDAAGVSPRNPQYAEMVFRTNMMSAYNAGSREEMQDPDVAEDFPVWQYVGIADGRQRPEHAIHFNQYFDNDTDFEEVRDSEYEGDFSGYNCRCVPRPIYKDEWQQLQDDGATVSTFAEKIPLPDLRQQKDYSCGAAALRAALAHFGIERPERDLRDELGTDPATGTPPLALKRVARRHGLHVRAGHGLHLAEVDHHLRRGRLILAPIQAHGPADEFAADAHGHYVVVNGLTDGRVHYHDPVSGQRSLPYREFVRRWHDQDGVGRRYQRFGLVLAGPPGTENFCGGKGGKPGPCPLRGPEPAKSPKPRVPEQEPSAKAQRAKAAHKLVNKDIQRYAEEHNEPAFAKSMGGVSFPDSEPIDVAIPGPSGAVGHGVELKTMVDNGNNKLTMDSYAQVRKIIWEQQQKATYHTVVLDDTKVYNANGPGQHDESQRVIYYRRGVAGSARVGNMHEVKGGPKELKRLMAMPEKDLPTAAQRTDGKLRVGRWKPFTDDQGKGFKNAKTGQVVRAKK